MSTFSGITILTLLLLVQYEARDTDIMSHLTREVCMDELGCFNAGSPFFDIVERPISLLPDDREDINTKFLLYTVTNPNTPQNFSNIDKTAENVARSVFDPHQSVKFIIPGFISRTAPDWKRPLIDALLHVGGGSNVFMVDWTGGDGPLYEQAVANTRVVGAEIALFIEHLRNATGVRPENVHLVGHSLGAHIAGYAGKRINKLARITALDPAGPYFTNVDPVVRLDRDDALLVDVIHTNGAPTRFQGFGLSESIGHFDFYPNGGHLQPGCKDMGHAILDFLSHPSFDAEGLRVIQCNHVRAILLFISNIPKNYFELIGTSCDSWENFLDLKCGKCINRSINDGHCIPLGMDAGEYVSEIDHGKSLNFYLNTTAKPPYFFN